MSVSADLWMPMVRTDLFACPVIELCGVVDFNRELTSYKGEADPFKGDVPNQRVRDMAKEALDAMFAATDPSYSAAFQTPSLTVGFWRGTTSDPAVVENYSVLCVR